MKGLNQQLEEKCKKSERERRDNEAYERRKLQEDRLSVELERNLERKRKEVEKRLIEFRQVYQKPSDRREFDLNDPEFLKKSRFERNRFSSSEKIQDTFNFGILDLMEKTRHRVKGQNNKKNKPELGYCNKWLKKDEFMKKSV